MSDSMSLPGYRGVVAWQKSMDLAVSVYRASRGLPDDERYGLTSQMRRAASSIPANIAEGRGRGGQTEYVRFLRIAYGSLCELETHLQLAHRLEFVDSERLSDLLARTSEVGRLLNGLIRSQKHGS
jgi:four helix bundle protein